MRSRNDNARLKIILPDETSDARSGDDAGESDRSSGLTKTGGKKRGDVWARLTGIHTDENVGLAMFQLQRRSKSAPGSVEGGVVQRRRARDAAHTICSEEFFGHEKVCASLTGKRDRLSCNLEKGTESLAHELRKEPRRGPNTFKA